MKLTEKTSAQSQTGVEDTTTLLKNRPYLPLIAQKEMPAALLPDRCYKFFLRTGTGTFRPRQENARGPKIALCLRTSSTTRYVRDYESRFDAALADIKRELQPKEGRML
ncbi:MAG: hypothetical protein LBS77_02125 [Desulfovibrio sp.]|jgi:hypothetical protein|nr:hypothetical protein [Desulfovibrio sp.]